MAESGSKRTSSTEDLRKTIGEIREELARARTRERELSSMLDSIGSEPEKAVVKSDPQLKTEIKAEPGRISTGIKKFDDLAYGGLQPGTNLVLYGPPFSEKYIMAYNFIARSLDEDIPIIVVTADKNIREIMYEVGKITEKINGSEQRGMLRFIDVYSKSIQIESASRYAMTLDSPMNISALMKAVDQIAAEIKKTHPYYRLLFSSLTTYVTLLEDKTFIRFTQQFSQKRKSENAVSMFLLEEGLFEKRVYEAISYLMDGAVEFRMGSTRNFLRVMGLGKTRSREWIDIYPEEHGFNLGSFSLEKVR
ncbi:circadian clock protein KaiC [Thermoplasmatales archaeon]|nr:circadian clock protein KaiC [Thermoplasmatales archaeon]